MAFDDSRITDNLARVHEQIAAACQRSGRDVNSVRLVCVTKYAENAWIQSLLDNGIRHLAENRPQQLVTRAACFPSTIEWHLVGHLQRNKVRRILSTTSLIHSVDSLRLLTRIDHLAKETHSRPRVLLQVNLTGEEARHGFTPSQLREVLTGAPAQETLAQSNSVEVIGLMAMAPFCDDPENSRPVFAELRRLTSELTTRSEGRYNLTEMSMGMSSDFEVAIEEGATLIRLGRGLFEGLDRKEETPPGPSAKTVIQ